MAIFNLNFLLKVGQVEMCQNPSPISTLLICLAPNSAEKYDLDIKMNFTAFFL